MAGEGKREEKARLFIFVARGKFVTGHHNPRILACCPTVQGECDSVKIFRIVALLM